MRHSARLLALVGVGLGVAACSGDAPPGRTFYDRNISPILIQSCSKGAGPCHAANDTQFQFAAGNLDVTSFENVQKRKDLLAPFGPYQIPPLLIKAVGPGNVQFAYGGADKVRNLEIQHVGGAGIQLSSDAYFTLLTWLENGATKTGLAPPTPPQTSTTPCSTSVPAGFDPAPYLANPNFAEFKSSVTPVIAGCQSGTCHGAPQADFYISCGADDTQLAFNFSQVWSFVGTPVDQSQFLRIPLAHTKGGGPHSGGDQFASREDARYLALSAWAEHVGPLVFGANDPGRQFFADNVQPVLIERGCAFPACHSPAAGNDFKLRTGGNGFFSAIALERNYELLRDEFMAVEYPDARRGRAVAKTVIPSDGGIAHRGGGVLETQGKAPADPATCPGTYDPATATAFCTVQKWLDIERAALGAQVTPMGVGATVPIVYVSRQATHVAGPLEFDTYQPDSDLLVADATLGAGQAIASVGAPRSLLDGCPGASNRATVDVRSPDVRHDGTTITFAMRTSAGDPLGVYVVDLAGTGCTRLTPAQPDQSGLKLHDFDPAWSPDGEWIVFASTRGGPGGPTRSRKLFLPQSDIWRMKKDGTGTEQMTFLSNSEIQPQMKRDGRVTMTTEKVSQGFYQLSGRRINWDRTDYHPLLAQRAESPYADLADPTQTKPSIGYQQATDIRENADANFLVILSDAGAKGGAGTLATFNRSIGPFEQGRTDDGYLPSVRIIDPAATGRVGAATQGAYRNPFGLPDGKIMASYAPYNGDLATATSFDWDIVAVDPRTGARTTLIGGAGAQVDAVFAFKSPPHKPYLNHRQLVFGGSLNPALGDHAVVHMPDAPLIFTLLTGNLRRGRPVEAFRGARQLAIYVEGHATASTVAGNTPSGIFESRTLLGKTNLASDGSLKIKVPGGAGVILELQDGSGKPIVTMSEEHQVAPGEQITMGIREDLFDAICASCHGSVSSSELDVLVSPDALTGASKSLSADKDPDSIGP